LDTDNAKRQSQQIDALARKYEPQLKASAETVQLQPLHEFDFGISWQSQTDPRSIRGQDAYDYLSIATDLSRESLLASRFSPEYLEDRLHQVLFQYIEGEDRGKRWLRELFAELLPYSLKQTVYLHVVGIALELPDLTVGEVCFRHANDEFIEEIARRQNDAFVAQGEEPRTGDDLSEQLNRIRKMVGQGLVAVYDVVAEPKRAEERALDEVRRALEVIMFAWIGANANNYWADAVPRLNVLPVKEYPHVVLASNEGISFRLGRPPSDGPMFINAQMRSLMDANGMKVLSDLLVKPSPTDLERAILRAVHWVGAAQGQEDDQNRLLNLITALETVLNPIDRQNISRSIGEGVALLIRQNIGSRPQLRQTITKAYDKRSATSHGGIRAVEATELKELRSIVLEVVQQTIRCRQWFSTREDLQNWLYQAKMDSPRIMPNERSSLRNLRRLAGLEQGELATRLRVSADDVHRWETRAPTFDELDRLADFFKVPKSTIDFPGRFVWQEVDQREFMIELHESSFGSWEARIESMRLGVLPGIAIPSSTCPLDSRLAALEAMEAAIRKAIHIAFQEEAHDAAKASQSVDCT